MKEVIKENVKLVNRSTQTMLLRELVRKKIPLKDVMSIEAKLRWNGRGPMDLELMQFLMKRKLKSALIEGSWSDLKVALLIPSKLRSAHN